MSSLLNVYLYIFVSMVSILAFYPIYKVDNKKAWFIIFLFLSLSSVLVVLLTRNIYAPQDINSYIGIYNVWVESFDDVLYHSFGGSVFFSFILYIGKQLNIDHETFYYLLSIGYLLVFYAGLKLIFKKHSYSLLGISFFVLSSTFVLLYTNVLRQGMALSLFVLAIGLYLNRNVITSYIVLVFSVFSHFSMLPFGLAFIFIQYISKKKLDYRYIFLFILILPFLGTSLMTFLASLGGLFNKIEGFGSLPYNNILVYIKLFILYLFGVLCYIYGQKFNNFKIYGYKFIFNLYLFGLGLSLFFLPILLISSRFIYYSSGLMPILLVYIFYSNKNFLNLKNRYVLFLLGMITYGMFVYNFESIRMQLFY